MKRNDLQGWKSIGAGKPQCKRPKEEAKSALAGRTLSAMFLSFSIHPKVTI
jgi:hypothetical protein